MLPEDVQIAYENAFCRELDRRGIDCDGIAQPGLAPAVFAKRVCDRLGGPVLPSRVQWSEDMIGIPRDSYVEIPNDSRVVFVWVPDGLDLRRVPTLEVFLSLYGQVCILSIAPASDDPLTITIPRFVWTELPAITQPDWDECWRPK